MSPDKVLPSGRKGSLLDGLVTDDRLGVWPRNTVKHALASG